MADEYFYGVTLKGANAKEQWDPEAKSEGNEYQGGHKLVIKQVALDADASDEVTVVEVEAMSWKEQITIPIATLFKAGQRTVQLDLSFPDPPVTFKLARGTGPVHLMGHHLIGGPVEEFDEMDEMEEEMLDEEEDGGEEGLEDEDEEEDGPKVKKAKSSNSAAPPGKIAATKLANSGNNSAAKPKVATTPKK